MSKRLRDPVHGLIVFDDGDLLQVDPLAWALIDTSEFQRLRRIRQLGVSEFTFPSAVHTPVLPIPSACFILHECS